MAAAVIHLRSVAPALVLEWWVVQAVFEETVDLVCMDSGSRVTLLPLRVSRRSISSQTTYPSLQKGKKKGVVSINVNTQSPSLAQELFRGLGGREGPGWSLMGGWSVRSEMSPAWSRANLKGRGTDAGTGIGG